MRRSTRLLLLLVTGLPVVSCFDFGEYSFPERDEGAAGTSNQIGQGTGSAQPGSGGSGVSTEPSGNSGGCAEPPCGVTPLAGAIGASCQSGRDCNTGFCADGVCCQEACTASCEACNAPGSIGYCQGIEQDDSCNATQACPPASACVDYPAGAGGGACAGRGSCSSGCTPAYKPVGTPCGESGQCDGGGSCVGGGLLALGQPCESNDQCTEGFCSATASGARVCCNQACNGRCEQCSALGLCNEAPAADPVNCMITPCPADDVCFDYPDTPTEARCASFGNCVGEAACEGESLRPTAECACGPAGCKLVQGAACLSGAQCTTGFCNNGVCCNEACNGTCEQCSRDTGACGGIAGCECAPGQVSTCALQFGSRGDCAARSITCSGAGQWPAQQCNAQSAELCNNDNRDEDCNGDPRNGCACLNGTLSDCSEQRRAQGVCARRTLTCMNGQWPVAQCNPTSNEVCRNGQDDDCDGAVDENPPCAPVFDGNNCDFGRASCDPLRCDQCGGCDGCQQVIICVRDSNPGCATANDPLCSRQCAAEIADAEQQFFGANFDIPATEFARDYINCVCTR